MKMGRPAKKVIAVNTETGERKEFGSQYSAAMFLGVSNTHVCACIRAGTELRGWKFYDTPENIRKRIKELKKQLKDLGYESD